MRRVDRGTLNTFAALEYIHFFNFTVLIACILFLARNNFKPLFSLLSFVRKIRRNDQTSFYYLAINF